MEKGGNNVWLGWEKEDKTIRSIAASWKWTHSVELGHNHSVDDFFILVRAERDGVDHIFFSSTNVAESLTNISSCNVITVCNVVQITECHQIQLATSPLRTCFLLRGRRQIQCCFVLLSELLHMTIS